MLHSVFAAARNEEQAGWTTAQQATNVIWDLHMMHWDEGAAYGVSVMTYHSMAMRLTGTRFERRDVVDEGALKQVLEDAVALLEGNHLVGNNPGRLKASYPIRINRERQSDPLGDQWQTLDSGRSGRVARLAVESSDRAVGNLQAQAAIGELKRLLALEEGGWSGCAILARTHQYLWPVQALCELAGVPYFLASDKDSALPITRQRDFVAVVDRLREVHEALSAAMAWQQVSAGVGESWCNFFQEAFTQLQVELGECQLNSAAIVDWLYDYAREMRQQTKSGLYLGTVHSAKGLEFRHVVLLDGGWNVQTEGLNCANASR